MGHVLFLRRIRVVFAPSHSHTFLCIQSTFIVAACINIQLYYIQLHYFAYNIPFAFQCLQIAFSSHLYSLCWRAAFRLHLLHLLHTYALLCILKFLHFAALSNLYIQVHTTALPCFTFTIHLVKNTFMCIHLHAPPLPTKRCSCLGAYYIGIHY